MFVLDLHLRGASDRCLVLEGIGGEPIDVVVERGRSDSFSPIAVQVRRHRVWARAGGLQTGEADGVARLASRQAAGGCPTYRLNARLKEDSDS